MTGRWQTASVFISSTFRDMHSERDILIKKVFPDIRARLLPYRIRLIDIDLRWGITQEEAENEKTIDFCLDSVSDCRPLFLGILGERYGWIPAPYPESIIRRFPQLVEDGQTSITALEIIHGVLSEQKENAVFLFRDRQFEASVPEEFASIVRAESPMHEQKQEELRELIRQQRLVSPLVENYPCTFRGLYVDWELLSAEAPADVDAFMKRYSRKGLILKEDIDRAPEEVIPWLQEHATLVLDQLEVFVEEVQKALWKMLCHSFPELNDTHPLEGDPEQLEDDEHQRLMDEHLATFLGREGLREEFRRYDSGKLVACTGASGQGKTALLAALIDDWKDRWPGGETVFHFVGATSSGRSAEGLFSRLLRRVARSAGVEVPGGISKDFLPNALRRLIEEFPADKKLLIAVDDFDLVFKSEGFDLRWLPRKIPSHVSILLSVLDDQSWSEKNLRQMGKAGAQLLPLPALRENERKEIIRKIPSIWAKTLDSRQIDLLSDHPGANNPLYLTIALEELRKFGSFERLGKRIGSFPHTTGEEGLILLYEQLLARLERELDREVVSRALGLLVCSVTGLGEEEIMRLCPDINRDNLAQLWRELRTHLLFSQGSMGFYHSTFSAAIRKRYMATRGEKQAFHRQLAEFFQLYPDKERALAELPEHYFELDQGEDIRRLLREPENYLLMRQRYPYRLNTNWDRIGENNPLVLLHESLCRNLGAYPEVLNHEDGIPMDYWNWQSTGEQAAWIYDEARDATIRPVLAPWQHDYLIELSRHVEESRLSGESSLFLAVKCLAILEAELGAVHARTLEALSVALPLLDSQMKQDVSLGYHTRAYMAAMSYLPEHHPVCLKIRMHNQDCLRKASPEISFTDHFGELAEAYVSSRDCSRMRELEQDSHIRENQRREFFAHLLIRHSQMLRQAGESQASLVFCEKAVAFCDRELGPVHEFAILARSNLAMYYSEIASDFEAGRKILEEALSFSDARVGTSSYIGLTLLNNLSATLGNSGKFEEALPVYRETVVRKKEVYGLENASTLHSIYNLAWCYRNMGEYDQALELCRQALAGFESLGEGYRSDWMQIKLNEIGIIEESGDAETARKLFEPFYQEFMEGFDGIDWLSYFLLSSKRASTFRKQDRLEEAAGIYEEASRVLGPVEAAAKESQSVFEKLMDTLSQLLDAASESKDAEARMKVLQRIVAACELRFPGGDPLLYHWQTQYGEELNKAERFGEAEALLRNCVRGLTESKGSGDPATRIASFQLARSLTGLGREEESLELFEKTTEAARSRKTDTVSMLQRHLREIEEKYGPDHPQTIRTLQEGAEYLVEEKHAQEALPILRQAFERSEKAFGLLSDQTTDIAFSLAKLHMDIKEHEKAEPILRRLAEGFERDGGLANERTVEAMFNLGKALTGMDESTEAIEVFKNCMEGSQELYGPQALTTLRALVRLTMLLNKVGNKEEFDIGYPLYVKRMSALGESRRVKELFTAYREQAEKERDQRIGRTIAVLKEQRKQDKLRYTARSERKLRKQAEEFSERELKPESPEGSAELMQWLELLHWLIPEKETVELWEAFCTLFEALCHKDDPALYLPRFKYALWILSNEGVGEALDQLSAIWQGGKVQSHFVQEAAFAIFDTLSRHYKPEEVIPVAQNMADNFAEALGSGHPRTHGFMNVMAGYLFEIGELKMARDAYSFLLDQTGEALGKDHPFVQNILQKLEAIDGQSG